MNFSPNRPGSGGETRHEGRVILLMAVLMFGGAVFMLGRAWYEKRSPDTDTTTAEAGLTAIQFISTENILDRIKKGEDPKIVDVRPRASFEANHLIDSEWLGLAEIATYSAPTGQLIVIVYGEENTNDQLREIHNRFTEKKMTFSFLEGGIRTWMAKGGTVISEGNPSSYVDQTKVIPVTPEQTIELLQTLVRSIVIDVRSEREYAAGHIPGALNFPLSRLEKDRKSIPAIGSLFVYGAKEIDTFQAGTQLFDMGFLGLRVITGGFEAWQAKGLPIETPAK